MNSNNLRCKWDNIWEEHFCKATSILTNVFRWMPWKSWWFALPITTHCTMLIFNTTFSSPSRILFNKYHRHIDEKLNKTIKRKCSYSRNETFSYIIDNDSEAQPKMISVYTLEFLPAFCYLMEPVQWKRNTYIHKKMWINCSFWSSFGVISKRILYLVMLNNSWLKSFVWAKV